MSLLEYEKIPSSFKNLNLTEAGLARLDKVMWCATEKIHGANFRFIYQDKKLLFGKRKELLHWEDDFFGFQKVAVELESQVLALFEKLASCYPADSIIIYGELFGGMYPHPEVLPNEQVDAVQTGIYYAPDIHFCTYDIAYGQAPLAGKTYLAYDKAIALFEEFGLLYAKSIRIGRLPELLSLNLRLDTQIPFHFHLPAIPNNLIEGIVIKPYSDLPAGINVRPIIKIKNPEFQENPGYHEARKWSYVPNLQLKSHELDFLLKDLRAYVTVARVNSAISKIGKVNSDERRLEVEKEVMEDILTDFNIDNDAFLTELNPTQKSWLADRLRAEIKFLMK